MPTHKAPLLVTAALVREGDRLLIAQRKQNASGGSCKWEFPGGKVEYTEHPEESLVREIKEELNLEIDIERFYDMVSHVYELDDGGRLHVVLLFYLCTKRGGDLEVLDAADARWIEVGELRSYDFAAADVPVVERILRCPHELFGEGSV